MLPVLFFFVMLCWVLGYEVWCVLGAVLGCCARVLALFLLLLLLCCFSCMYAGVLCYAGVLVVLFSVFC